MLNKSIFLQFAIQTAKEAGRIQMKYFGNISSLEKKSNNIDLLTNADIESEKHIVTQIKFSFPNHFLLYFLLLLSIHVFYRNLPNLL